MRRHRLPHTDLEVSALCYGVASFGTGATGETMERLFAAFREAGGNFFDTAHCYSFWIAGGPGSSERGLGHCLRRFGGRDAIVIGTKGGHPDMGPDYPRPDRYLSPEVIASDIAQSRERLGVEQIDLYYLHRDDPRVPVGEIIDTLNAHVAQGQVRYLGASNWAVARIEAANAYAAGRQLRGFVVSQPQWSLGEPNWRSGPDPTVRFLTPEDQAWHAAHQLPVAPYSATANGYFATAGARGKAFQNSVNEGRLQRAQAVAAELSRTPNQIALAYLMHQPFPVVPILGTADHGHLADALGAAAVSLTPEQVRWLRDG